MDQQIPDINYSTFGTDTLEFNEDYRDAKEELPKHLPKAQGRAVSQLPLLTPHMGLIKRLDSLILDTSYL